MKIVHTADWHLGARLGRIDRTDDLRRAVADVAAICHAESADVLLICGDLFSELNRADTLRGWMEYLSQTFTPFLQGGGTILAITGNHDNDNFAHVLREAMGLAAPDKGEDGGLLKPGRFHFFTGPTFFRLAGRDGQLVQCIAMPSPTPSRYLTAAELAAYQTKEERNRAIKTNFSQRIKQCFKDPRFDPKCQTVLAAHILSSGAEVRAGVRVNEADGIVVADGDLPTHLAYVALGDVHKPQPIMNLAHVRYCGSIERLNLGEADDEKGVDVVEIGSSGLLAPPRRVPLEATPIYEVVISDPPAEMGGLKDRYPDRERALVRIVLKYRAGRDNLSELLAQLDEIFPRWYERDWRESGADTNGAAPADDGQSNGDPAAPRRTFCDTVGDYVAARLDGHEQREPILQLLDELLAEEK